MYPDNRNNQDDSQYRKIVRGTFDIDGILLFIWNENCDSIYIYEQNGFFRWPQPRNFAWFIIIVYLIDKYLDMEFQSFYAHHPDIYIT